MHPAPRCFFAFARQVYRNTASRRASGTRMVQRDTFSTVVAREKPLAWPQIARRIVLRGVLDESPVLDYLCARHVCRAAAALT
jgi:hypothetical protein